MNLLAELASGPLIADGAIGTVLMQRGVQMGTCFEELCVSSPELIEGIHREYIEAGARIIKTHTFGANVSRLSWHGFERRVKELNTAAAKLARSAAAGRKVFVAGCVGPLWKPKWGTIDRQAAYRTQIDTLCAAGVDLLHFETFTDLNELLLAFDGLGDPFFLYPSICSLVCQDSGTLTDGTPLAEAFQKLTDAGAALCGVNCVPVERGCRLLENLASHYHVALSPSCGPAQDDRGWPMPDESPIPFAHAMTKAADHGVRILGGCCWTTPQHIAALATALKAK